MLQDIKSQLKSFLKENCNSYVQTGQSYVFDCPLCYGKKKLYIRKKDGKFICFKCSEINNFRGKAEKALTLLANISIADVQRALYFNIDIENLDLEDDEIIQEEIFITDWPEDAFLLNTWQSIPGASYLLKRDIPLDVAISYDIRYQPSSGRVLFPVFFNAHLAGWQGRHIGDKVPKIKSSSNLDKGKLLMFSKNLINSKHAILTEGPVDALRCHYLGGSVCSMGKNVSEQQLHTLLTCGIQELYLALDPDAYIESQKIVQKLNGRLIIKQMKILEGKKDLGEMSFEEAKESFDSAETVDPTKIMFYI